MNLSAFGGWFYRYLRVIYCLYRVLCFIAWFWMGFFRVALADYKGMILANSDIQGTTDWKDDIPLGLRSKQEAW